VNFDPAALWALVRTVGLYPAGTLLQTNTNHIVLVLSPNPRDVARPFVRVLARPDGSSPDANNPEDWSPMPRDIGAVKVLPPDSVETNTADQLAA
jgi:hypothetical protein